MKTTIILSALICMVAQISACKPSEPESEPSEASETVATAICTNLSRYEHEFSSDVSEDCAGFISEIRRECGAGGQAVLDCFLAATSGEAVDACEALCE